MFQKQCERKQHISYATDHFADIKKKPIMKAAGFCMHKRGKCDYLQKNRGRFSKMLNKTYQQISL